MGHLAASSQPQATARFFIVRKHNNLRRVIRAIKSGLEHAISAYTRKRFVGKSDKFHGSRIGKANIKKRVKYRPRVIDSAQ